MDGIEGADQFGQAVSEMIFGLDYSKMATSALIMALLNIPILIGVLMMWKQKKVGFYVYTAFEIIQAVMPMIIIGGLAGIGASVWYLILAVLFIILYAVNLKHMA